MTTKRRGRHEKHHKAQKERSPSPVQSSDSDPELDNDEEQRLYQPTSPAQWSHHRHSINSIASVSNIQAGPRDSNTAMLAARRSINGLPPELLIHIFRQLTDIADHHSCLFVSRTWCQCAVELLWLKPHLTSLKALNAFLRVISPGFIPLPTDTETVLGFDSREAIVNGRWQSAENVDQDPKPEDNREIEEVASINKLEMETCFPYARFVRRLNLSGVAEDLKDAHFQCLSACTRLERLTLNGCIHLTDASLSILSGMADLVALDLTGVVDVTDATIISLANSSNKLQGINLEGCKKITDEGIIAMANSFPLLRRIKLCELENITGDSVSKLVQSCPLLIEIDLNACASVSEAAVRDIWVYCTHLRELRLAQCARIGDIAFPVPPKVAAPINSYVPSANSSTVPEAGPLTRLTIPSLPPLFLNQHLLHLRQLDLMQLPITDEAVAGIIANAPKLRNLVLAKCSALTDAAVKSISQLGRHLQFLHLGHAIAVTDNSIVQLATRCVRLRYVDLACCPSLTNKSVRALAALPKLRRVGLVRVFNLTDDAVDYLSVRQNTLERVHLSYCEKITVAAIHRLLQRLTKLTHLSLTGVPAFRKQDLQRFCRPPPSNFNDTQRAAFCVYSGNGINQLRRYLESIAPKIQAYTSGGEGDESNMSFGEHNLSETDRDSQDGEGDISAHFSVPVQGPSIPNLSYPSSGGGSQSGGSPTPPPADFFPNSGSNGTILHGISRSQGTTGTSRDGSRTQPSARNQESSDPVAPTAHAGMTNSDGPSDNRSAMRHRAMAGSVSNPLLGVHLRSKLQRTSAREDSGAPTATATGADLPSSSRRANYLWMLPSNTSTSVPSSQAPPVTGPPNTSASAPSVMHAMIRTRNGTSTSRRGTAVSPPVPNTNQVGTTGSDSVVRNVNQPTLSSSSQLQQLQTRAQARIQATETNWTSDSSREGEGEGDAEGDIEAELSLSSRTHRSPMKIGKSSSAHGECEGNSGRNTPIKGYDVSDTGTNRKGHNGFNSLGFPLHDSPADSRTSTPSPSRLNGRVRRSIRVTLSAAEHYATSLFRGKGKNRERSSSPGPGLIRRSEDNQ